MLVFGFSCFALLINVGELGVVPVFMNYLFNCIRSSVTITMIQRYVEESVDHEVECCMLLYCVRWLPCV